MTEENLIIPNDLVPLKEAAELFEYANVTGIQYYISTGRLRSYRGARNRLYVSKSEIRDILKPPFKLLK